MSYRLTLLVLFSGIGAAATLSCASGATPTTVQPDDLELLVVSELREVRQQQAVPLRFRLTNISGKTITLCPRGDLIVSVGAWTMTRLPSHSGCAESDRFTLGPSGEHVWQVLFELRECPEFPTPKPEKFLVCEGDARISASMGLVVGKRCTRRTPCKNLEIHSEKSTVVIRGSLNGD